MNGIPFEARQGLTRVWLSILAERNPNVTWVAAEHDTAVERGPPTTAHPVRVNRVLVTLRTNDKLATVWDKCPRRSPFLRASLRPTAPAPAARSAA